MVKNFAKKKKTHLNRQSLYHVFFQKKKFLLLIRVGLILKKGLGYRISNLTARGKKRKKKKGKSRLNL